MSDVVIWNSVVTGESSTGAADQFNTSTGLFTAHQLKLIGLDCEIVDNLDKIGGQCIELYPDKPIYDIPAVPECTGEQLTNNLMRPIFTFDSFLNRWQGTSLFLCHPQNQGS